MRDVRTLTLGTVVLGLSYNLRNILQDMIRSHSVMYRICMQITVHRSNHISTMRHILIFSLGVVLFFLFFIVKRLQLQSFGGGLNQISQLNFHIYGKGVNITPIVTIDSLNKTLYLNVRLDEVWQVSHLGVIILDSNNLMRIETNNQVIVKKAQQRTGRPSIFNAYTCTRDHEEFTVHQ